MPSFQETPDYCITYGGKQWVDYKQAKDRAALTTIMRAMRKATAPRKRAIFVIVYKNNRMIYRCWRGERGLDALRDWGLLYE